MIQTRPEVRKFRGSSWTNCIELFEKDALSSLCYQSSLLKKWLSLINEHCLKETYFLPHYTVNVIIETKQEHHGGSFWELAKDIIVRLPNWNQIETQNASLLILFNHCYQNGFSVWSRMIEGRSKILSHKDKFSFFKCCFTRHVA